MVEQIILNFLSFAVFCINSQINQKAITRLVKPEDESKIINIQYSSLKLLAAKDYNYSQMKANIYRTIQKTYLLLYSTYVPCIKMKKRLLPVSYREVILKIVQLNLAVIMTAIATSCWSI